MSEFHFEIERLRDGVWVTLDEEDDTLNTSPPAAIFKTKEDAKKWIEYNWITVVQKRTPVRVVAVRTIRTVVE